MLLRNVSVGVALGLAALAAQAQSFRCIGPDGKKYYGQSVPPQCVGVVVEQLNAQGNVIKRIDPRAEAEARAKRAAEEAERKRQALLAKEQGRRDQALLATYSSEKDVEDMRRRSLENDQRIMQDLEARIAALKQRRDLSGADTKGIDKELRAQEELLASKQKGVAAINAKYDEDKKRYLELKALGK